LLLDDDTEALETATRLLEGAGFEVVLSGRRHGKVDFIARTHPDLVLLGVRLPYLAGDEVLTALAWHPMLKRIPVVILSSSDPAYLEDLVRDSGARSFVRKSELRRELLARVEAGLQPRSAA
jgi:DNA-binding response OmpR family regulator